MFNKINLLNPLNPIVENPLKTPMQTNISQSFDTNQNKDESENLLLNSNISDSNSIE
ncbi:hypothetical protein [uncultured Clostridium sp.]|uniref:hypothetical protein n=1 Tax=uncultured Clostridium sp. TaxID=59620 RepID=UPI00263995EA|nr:hypothetical protein [uncultured Clostridium sp.]